MFCISFYMNFANEKFLVECFCFAFAWDWGNYFGSRCDIFYLRLLLCTGRGQAISQYRHLYWTLETGDIPSNRHPADQWTSDHVNIATGDLGTNTGIMCHHENTSDESFISMLRVQELWNVWNSSDWLLLSLYITGNFPRLPRVRSDCQVQGSHLTPHDRSFQTKVPWFYWVFFHCPRIFVQFQFLLTAKLTTNRLLV